MFIGIHWIRKRNFFYKRTMTNGASLKALQWLVFVQENDSRLMNGNNERVRLEHKFFRGEKRILEWDIDGFAEVDGKKLFYEFLGCWHHVGCQNFNCKYYSPDQTDEVFERKKKDLEENGTLVIMRFG